MFFFGSDVIKDINVFGENVFMSIKDSDGVEVGWRKIRSVR